MTQSDGLLRAQAFEAYESIPSLDAHGELTRLILAEVSLLAEKYRNVRRHDVPHIRELVGLLDVFWQEVEMDMVGAGPGAPEEPAETHPPSRSGPFDDDPAARSGYAARRASPAAAYPPMKPSTQDRLTSPGMLGRAVR